MRDNTLWAVQGAAALVGWVTFILATTYYCDNSEKREVDLEKTRIEACMRSGGQYLTRPRTWERICVRHVNDLAGPTE